MDKVNSDNLGGVEVEQADYTWDAPEATSEKPQATEPEESGDEAAQPKPEASDAEKAPEKTEGEGELILGKFKSTDDLAKSYSELEKYKTQLEQERASLKHQMQNASPQQQQQLRGQVDELNDLLDKVYDDPKYMGEYINKALDKRMQPFVQDYVKAMTKMNIDNAKKSHDDFSDYEGRIADILGELPPLPPDTDIVEFAYKIAKAERMDDLLKEAEERGRKSAIENKKKKDAVYVEGSGQASKGVVDDDAQLFEKALETGDWTKLIQKRTGLK